MITGHNTDITHNGVIYHVQTEDKGKSNPIVETLVYKGGEILDAKRTSYVEMIQDGYDEKKIISLIEEQHRTVISEIKVGKYDKGGGAVLLSDALGIDLIDSQKSLDQVILEYLASEAEKERLVLELKGDHEVIEGTPCTLNVLTKSSTSGEALKGARIIIKIISTVKKPLTIYDGKTDRAGILSVEFTVPEFPDGNAALLVQSFSDIGTDEIKLFIGKKNQNGNADQKS
jgi:hypothetical protein